MSKTLADSATASGLAAATPLSGARVGQGGVIARVDGRLAGQGVLDPEELERRLLELGFVEGARVRILHEGLFGGDPIAVKLDDMRVAVRRREARAIEVSLD
ncbi:MAG TPA: FeoA domain-containing protein [Caulobacter sp.]|nr:FeoA domain-containing protein [Caulobacter sp.]